MFIKKILSIAALLTGLLHGQMKTANTFAQETALIDNVPAPTEDVPSPSDSPVATPPLLPEQIPTPTPPQVPFPSDVKNFSLTCKKDIARKLGDLEVMSLNVGETLSCRLVVHQGLISKSNNGVKVSTELKIGNKVSIKADPVEGVTDDKGGFEITLTAIDTGIDWIAWAIADEDGHLGFNNEAYDSGNAWGMFVIVK